jgi:hypothetical protein
MAAMLPDRRSRTVNPIEVGDRKMQLKRKLAILAVPAVLALGGGAIAVNAANTPTPTPASSQKEAPEAPEAPETAAGTAAEVETADAAGDVQSGHSDPAGEVDHQANGTE